MHKYYKENYLYHVKPEEINCIACQDDRVWFKFVSGPSASICCDDNETAKLVYRDICSRLRKLGNFAKAGSRLLNISNIKGLKRLRNNKPEEIIVFYEGKASESLYFVDENESNIVYEHLAKKLDDCINEKKSV